MAKQKSYKGKKQYPAYKAENRVFKNKVRKLERHCKKFPDDKEAEKNLARIRKDGYKAKSAPREPGSNQTYQIPEFTHGPRYFEFLPKTAAEQLSEIFNIPIPKKTYKKRKPFVTHKKRKNVKA